MTSLSIALGKYPHTAALRDHSVTPEGYELNFAEVEGSIINAFRRMTRELAYDVSEMAISTYLVAKEYGKPFTAIPVFVVRGFPQRAIMVNTAAVSSPKDLEGKRVGLHANTVTTGVWARGVLSETYGVDLDSITWVVAEEEHVKEYELPDNVEVAAGADLGAMLVAGELAGGIGVLRDAAEGVAPLVTDRKSAEEAWAQKGLYPINHTVVVKDSLLAEDPSLAGKLFQAFTAAKAPLIERINGSAELTEAEQPFANIRSLVGDDPLPYGVEANRMTLETVLKFAREQHVVRGDLQIDGVFAAV